MLNPVSPAELTGNSAAQVVAAVGEALWVLFVAPSGNSGVVRVGDSNVSATRGIPIAAGTGFMLPFSQGLIGYDLSKLYWYAASPDKVNIIWVT